MLKTSGPPVQLGSRIAWEKLVSEAGKSHIVAELRTLLTKDLGDDARKRVADLIARATPAEIYHVLVNIASNELSNPATEYIVREERKKSGKSARHNARDEAAALLWEQICRQTCTKDGPILADRLQARLLADTIWIQHTDTANINTVTTRLIAEYARAKGLKGEDEKLRGEEYTTLWDEAMGFWKRADPGGGLKERARRFEEWLQAQATIRDLEAFRYVEFSALWPTIARHAKAIGEARGNRLAIHLLSDCHCAHLFANPAFKEDGFRQVAGDIIESMASTLTDTLGMKAVKSFFYVSQVRGWKLDTRQIQQLEAACMAVAALPGDGVHPRMTVLGCVPEAAKGRSREIILRYVQSKGGRSRQGTDLLTGMLRHSRGNEWVGLIKTIMSRDIGLERRYNLYKELKSTPIECLDGVSCEDIVFLHSHDEPNVRGCARHLTNLILERDGVLVERVSAKLQV